MFKSAATKLAHSPTVRAVAPGSSDLGPLQQAIVTEKVVLQSIQKLSADFAKSTDALWEWASGEGEDLEDTFSACATLLNQWVSSLASFAGRVASVRECLKAVRTREEAFGEMRRNRRTLMSKAEYTEMRLNNMTSGEVYFRQQTNLLMSLREQIRTLDVKIMDEEASFGDAKRDKARELMDALFSGLLECSATGAVVATSGRAIVGCVPSDATQPGHPRAHYSGHPQVELLVAEAERTILRISTIGEAGISFGSEADVSFVSEAGDGTLQPPNGLPTGDAPGNAPPAPGPPIEPTPTSSPVQPTPIPTQSIQPSTSSNLPNNPPSNPHEPIDIAEFDPYFQSQANPAEREPHGVLLVSEAGGGSSQLPNGSRTGDTPPSSSSSPDQPPPIFPPLPQALSVEPNDPFSDLHGLCDFGWPGNTCDAPEMQNTDRVLGSETVTAQGKDTTEVSPSTLAIYNVSSSTPALSGNSEVLSKGKGKAEDLDEPLPDPIFNPYPICGVCLEPFQVTESPISASLVANNSARLPFGLYLPCPGEHTYCISCLTEYIKGKLDPGGAGGTSTNITVFPIPCPECPITDWESGILDEVAEKVFDAESMSVWHHRKLLDSLPRRYCPNPKCSVLVQIDEDYADPKAQCPACFQWVCVPCKAMWHKDMTCEKYQSLPSGVRSPEDQLVIELAKSEKWRRCPGCQAIVERSHGCNHMTCRCQMEFCFNCGSLWDTGGKKCSNDPACELWDERMLLDARERERVDNANRRPPAPVRVPTPPPVRPKKRNRNKDKACVTQ